MIHFLLICLLFLGISSGSGDSYDYEGSDAFKPSELEVQACQDMIARDLYDCPDDNTFEGSGDPVPVPEPGTMLLVLTGFAVGAIGKKFKK
ncbi:MAG: PEP-CTERM sorting domain-containing protein [Candidatus Omnitrophota bacterium]